MKRLALCAITLFAMTQTLVAQDRNKSATPLRRDAGAVSPTVQQTPEMWFYEQERSRYENPKEAVRRKAELRSAQRAERIASLAWYGMSNSRPTANTTPIFSTYSPTWVSNSFDPNRWRTGRDCATPVIIVR
jgi:hypothetical protein